jgi:hypothetical protein
VTVVATNIYLPEHAEVTAVAATAAQKGNSSTDLCHSVNDRRARRPLLQVRERRDGRHRFRRVADDGWTLSPSAASSARAA